MRSVSDWKGRKAEWVQPQALEQSYELRSGDEQLAALSFRSAFGSLANAGTADGSWTFKRVGFLNPRITARVAGSESDLAVYQPRFWGGGALVFADGRSFSWSATGFWGTRWEFRASGGGSALVFERGVSEERFSDFFKSQFTVTFPQDESMRGVLPLLATLGMYLLVLHQRDSAAVVATG
jgi:hypothetical protein